jgi:hypothetical protein
MRDSLRDKIGHTIILSNKDEDIYAKTLYFYHHPHIVHVNTIEDALSMLYYTFGHLNRRKSGNLSVTKATLPRTFSMSEGVKYIY